MRKLPWKMLSDVTQLYDGNQHGSVGMQREQASDLCFTFEPEVLFHMSMRHIITFSRMNGVN